MAVLAIGGEIDRIAGASSVERSWRPRLGSSSTINTRMKSFLEKRFGYSNTREAERLLVRNEAGDQARNVNSFPERRNHNSRGAVEDHFNRPSGRATMAVAKTIEIITGSAKGIEDAVRVGIAKASETVKAIEGAWIKDTKVVVQKAVSPNGASHWRLHSLSNDRQGRHLA